MKHLIAEIRRNRILWLLALVPAGHATESVASKTGDAVGGLPNATLGNLTELIIALSALRAGEHILVKASLAGHRRHDADRLHDGFARDAQRTFDLVRGRAGAAGLHHLRDDALPDAAERRLIAMG